MTSDILSFIKQTLQELGINYAFMQWNSDVVYPYFIGEYNEVEPTEEDQFYEANFILTGTSRGSWLELQQCKEAIENAFNTLTTILDNGSGVVVSYTGSFAVPTGDAELKRIQINLNIKEWRVNTNE